MTVRVTHRAIDMIRKVSHDSNIDLSRMVEGLAVSVEDIANPRDGVSWSDYATMCDRLLAILGPEALREAGRRFLEIPRVAAFAQIGGFFTSARRLYWAGARFSPGMFSGVTSSFAVLGPTEVEIGISILPELRDSRGFFIFNAGVFTVMPRMLHLPEAVVEVQIEPRRAVYRIIHPPAVSIWSRVRHLFIAFTSARRAYEELQAQNAALMRRLDEVIEARALAERASHTKSRFMANMSHELRTPMNGVLGLTELLLEGELSPEQRGLAEGIQSSARGLLSTIDDVLDFTQLDLERVKLRVLPYAPRDVLRSIVEAYQTHAVDKGLVLELHIDDAIPRELAGDARRLGRVLARLVSNAIKFTTHGRVTLRASVDGERVRFEVHDTGCGIPEAWRDRLFRPFVQVDDSLTRAQGGTGMGLAVCRQLVGELRGELGFTSQVDVGSCFWFTIPLARAAAPAEALSPPPAVAPRSSAPPALAPSTAAPVLIVEDNPVNQRVLAGMLRRLGYASDVAADGQQGVDAARVRFYPLILMDCQMPVMDGLEATRVIRAASTGAQPMIVAVTAHAIDGYRERCLETGMDDFITKPLKLETLERVLARVFIAR